MHTHNWCFCSPIKKLQAFEKLNRLFTTYRCKRRNPTSSDNNMDHLDVNISYIATSRVSCLVNSNAHPTWVPILDRFCRRQESTGISRPSMHGYVRKALLMLDKPCSCGISVAIYATTYTWCWRHDVPNYKRIASDFYVCGVRLWNAGSNFGR